MSVMRAAVVGIGSYLPEGVLTNEDLEKMVDTSDQWIVERTGIKRRHVAAKGQNTSDLGLAAAREALASAGVKPSEIDLVIVATTTADETFPSTATQIQGRLGMTRGAAFDLQAACSGFIYGLSMADKFIRCGEVETVLLIGAETMTRLVDWKDRNTCILFGDGAGAAVLKPVPGEGTLADRGILNAKIYSDGRYHDLLRTDGGPSLNQRAGVMKMEGPEVFKHAVNNIVAAIEASLAAAQVPITEIDWFVPHQANKRILDGTAKKLRIPPGKVISTIAEHGNTSAASVPLAMATAVKDGHIKRGDLLLLEAMGAGFTWAAALLRW